MRFSTKPSQTKRTDMDVRLNACGGVFSKCLAVHMFSHIVYTNLVLIRIECSRYCLHPQNLNLMNFWYFSILFGHLEATMGFAVANTLDYYCLNKMIVAVMMVTFYSDR